jgi:RsiW-degrading membrane proteinase PrsW (M82 family)
VNPTIEVISRVVLGFAPVVALLAALKALDAFQLVRVGDVLKTLILGAACAVAALVVNEFIADIFDLQTMTLSRYVAPVVEESAKAAVLVALVLRRRIGFLVDAGIHGFAVGAGFTLAENFYFWVARPEAGLAVWLVRGSGTAVMHAGTAAIIALAAKATADRRGDQRVVDWIPGLGLAVALHSLFNHFLLSPLLSAVGIALIVPPVVMAVFQWAVRRMQGWLHRGFDADTEMLALILSGHVSDSPVGAYLGSLRERFRGEVIVDLLCYLRIRLELSLHLKGLLFLREAGFVPEPDPQVHAKLQELEFLERSIGPTGRLALAPFLRDGPTASWQKEMLKGVGR